MSIHIFVMPMVLSMASLHSLGHNNQNEVKNDFFSHLMPLVPAPFSSGQEDNRNKVSYESFTQVMPLAPVQVSHGTDGMVNSTILLGQMIVTRCKMTF